MAKSAARCRRRRTAAEMRPLVEAWRRGEGTQAELAARHGMPAPTFAWWCGRVRRGDPAAAGFVAVDVKPEPPRTLVGTVLEVVLLGGRVLRIPWDLPDAELRRIFGALEAVC